MKKTSFFSIAATMCMLLFSCSIGNGTTFGNSGSVHNGKRSDANVKKSVKIGDFSKIDASQGIQIVYSQGKNSGHAQVATTPSAVDYLKVYVKDGCLYARYEGKFDRINGPSIITVSSKKLTEIDLSSAAYVNVVTDIDQRDGIGIDLSSAAKVDFKEVKCPKIKIDLSSSAKVDIAATKANLDIDCSSASAVNIGTAMCEKADIDISSASNVSIDKLVKSDLDIEASSAAKASIQMYDCNTVYAEASSGASVKLYGNCRSLRKDSSSGGKVSMSGTSTTCIGTDTTIAAAERNKAIAERNKAVAERNRAKAEKNRLKAEKNRIKAEKNKAKATKNVRKRRLRMPATFNCAYLNKHCNSLIVKRVIIRLL